MKFITIKILFNNGIEKEYTNPIPSEISQDDINQGIEEIDQLVRTAYQSKSGGYIAVTNGPIINLDQTCMIEVIPS